MPASRSSVTSMRGSFFAATIRRVSACKNVSRGSSAHQEARPYHAHGKHHRDELGSLSRSAVALSVLQYIGARRIGQGWMGLTESGAASTIAPAWGLSQAIQSSHQLPAFSTATLLHASALSLRRAGATQNERFGGLTGGLTIPRMCPELDRTNRFGPAT
jgi:hypothetical protein